jgi:hypothetical protein
VTQPGVLDPTQLLSLNCFVLGDDPKKIFTVKIPKTDNVSILKKLIKEEKASRLGHVDASDLDLWSVSIPVDCNLNESIGHLRLDGSEQLLPVEELSKVFSDPLKKHLHVVVKFKSEGEHCNYLSPFILFCGDCPLVLPLSFPFKVLRNNGSAYHLT